MLLAGYNIMYHISLHFIDFPTQAIMNIYIYPMAYPHFLSPEDDSVATAATGHMSACQF